MICAQCTAKIHRTNPCPECGQDPILAGQYHLLDVVGSGASGTTYMARNVHTEETVAIKELLIRKVDSFKSVELFEREAGVLQQLNHPGIPRYIDEFTEESGRSVSLYLVQEFIDGPNLEQEMEDYRFNQTDVLDVIVEILEILQYLHELHPPVIHRDIKPSNIMRRDGGGLVLIDFGSVRESVDKVEGGSTVAGTFGYMAPEQFVGRAVPATDIFGLGRTAINLLTREDPTDVKVVQGVSDSMLQLLNDMTENDVEQRPGDARKLAMRARSIVQGGFELAKVEPNSPHAALATSMIPAPPRQLPANFNARRFDLARFQLIFGAIFGGVGTVAGLAPLTIALITGEFVPLILGVIFLAVFGGIGGTSLVLGVRKMQLVKDLYQNGVVTTGVVYKQGWSNYSVNRQHARVHQYRFTANGLDYKGHLDTFEDYPIVEGDHVPVIYDAKNPRRSTIYPAWD